MEMTLNVKISGLENLVAVLDKFVAVPATVKSVDVPQLVVAPEATPQTAPVQQPIAASISVVPTAAPEQAPVQAPAPQPTSGQPIPAAQTAPVQPAPTTVPVQPSPVAAVPTTAPTYSIDDLRNAAAPLVDGGRLPELAALLRAFGVEMLTQLPPEHYGAFATQLRALGAKI